MYKRMLMICAIAVLALGGVVVAQQEAPQDQQMPPMGPPEEMKKCAALVGNWNAAMQMRMGPDAPWEEFPGTSRYELALDGGALMMHHEATFAGMPMPFHGLGIQTWDRETKQWQMVWIDNMACRTTLYTGPAEKDGKTVVTGEEMWNGMKMISRITTYNEKPDSFDWLMETSMDGGQTWFESGKATYTRVK